jgi:hypothetical protein
MSSRFPLAAIIGCLLWLLTGSAARADDLPVGLLSFDQFTNGYAVDLTNLTQPGGGSSVVTFLDFSSFTLTLNLSDGSSSTAALSAVDPFGDLGTGPIFPAGQVNSATLTGTFSPTTVVLADGSTVAIDPNSVTLLSDSAGPLVAGDFTLINVSTQPQATPEPGTALLLAAGLLLLVFRSRSHFRLWAAF